jgi:hypothetical protein
MNTLVLRRLPEDVLKQLAHTSLKFNSGLFFT